MCLAIPGKIVRIEEGNSPFEKIGKVSFGGIVKKVSLAYVPEAQIGNYIIVHVGFALNIIDEKEAQQTLADLEAIQTFT